MTPTVRWMLGLALAGACGLGAACQQAPPASEPQRLFADSPTTWVPPLPQLRVASDETLAVFGQGQWLQLVDLETGRQDDDLKIGDLDAVSDVAFRHDGTIVRRGTKAGATGWFLDAATSPLSGLPPDANVRWSPTNGEVALYRTTERRVARLGPIADLRRVQLEQDIQSIEWSHDGRAVVALVTDEHGSASLLRIDRFDAGVETIASDLDAPLRAASLELRPDDRAVYLPLASDGALDVLARHDPDADRNLDIYELELATGTRSARVVNPMDDLSPRVAGEHLYWTRVEYHQSIVAIPSAGGDAHLVAEAGQIPYWSHDGRLVGYTVGLPRASDAPLNMDVDVIEVDADARPVAEPRRLVDGFHEDFTPAWSPDGRWLAVHSHRSQTPVPFYHGEGVTDDMYLRRADASTSEEIRLTDFGWEMGMGDWSPDGRQLVFAGWEQGGTAGIGVPWIVTIDPESGQAISTERLELPEPLRSATLVSWSPVANEIAIENDEGDERHSIWILDLEDGSAEQVVEYDCDTYGGLDWTPNGQTIVYAARADGRYQLFAVPRSGGIPSKLSEDGGNLMQPQVSPDGRWIAATRVEFTRELWRGARQE